MTVGTGTTRMRWLAQVATVLLLVGSGAACSTTDDADVGVGSGTAAGSTNDDGPGKYEQTWSKSYGRTKCREWLNAMDPHQRFVAAADMLVGAQSADGGDDLPDDDLIREFTSGLDNVCPVNVQGSLAETAAALYLTEQARFRP